MKLGNGCNGQGLLFITACQTMSYGRVAGFVSVRRGDCPEGRVCSYAKIVVVAPLYRYRGFKLSAMKQHRGRVTRGQKDDKCPDTVKASRNSFSWGIPTITPLGR
jgi:hypothetical protein